MLASASDIEEGDQCYVFGCVGTFKFKTSDDCTCGVVAMNHRHVALTCDKCDVEIGGEEDGQDT